PLGWGDNEYGQIGDGTFGNATYPQFSGTGDDLNEITAGSSHSLAVGADGALWAWGYNGDGEIGDGSGEDQGYPVQVGEDYDWGMPTVNGIRVALTNPVFGLIETAPVNLSLVVSVIDPSNLVTLVEYYADTNKLGEASAPPYTFVWSNAPAG